MSATPARAAEHLPPHSGLPVPPGDRVRPVIRLAVATALLAHLLAAPVTLVVSGAAVVTGRLTRWHPLWLAVPAAAGAAWTAAIGVPRALAGFTAGPRHLAAYLAGIPGHPAQLRHSWMALAGSAHELPLQLPVALLAASAEAAVLGWLAARSRAPGRPSTGRQGAGRPGAGWPGAGWRSAGWTRDGRDWRPGLVAAVRRRHTRATLAAGHAATRTGFSLGLDPASGRPAEVGWMTATGGVLITSADPAAAARLAFPAASAAAALRKTVIVVDLTASLWLAEELAEVCAVAGARLTQFRPAPPATRPPDRIESEDPGGSRDPDLPTRRAARWIPVRPAAAQPARTRSAGSGKAGAEGDSAGPDGATSTGARSGGDRLAGARLASAGIAGAWPAGARRVRAQPSRDPSPDTGLAAIFRRAVQDRDVVLAALDRPMPGPAAAAAAERAVTGLTAELRWLHRQGLRGDCLAWIHGCDAARPASLAGLLELGQATGTAVLLSTASPAAVAHLAGSVAAVVPGGPAGQRLATQLAELHPQPTAQDLAAALRWQDEDEFAILARRRPGGGQPDYGRLMHGRRDNGQTDRGIAPRVRLGCRRVPRQLPGGGR